MKQCPKCGEKYENGFYCGECGEKLIVLTEDPENRDPEEKSEKSEKTVPELTENAAEQIEKTVAEADSLPGKSDEVTEQTETVSERTENVPDAIETVAGELENVTKQTENIPEQDETVPEQTVTVPEQTITAPEQTATFPEQTAIFTGQQRTAPVQTETAAYYNNAGSSDTAQEKENRPMTVGEIILVILVSFIPIGGLVMLLVWMLDKKENVQRRNLAAAILILEIVAVALSVIISGVSLAFMGMIAGTIMSGGGAL